jgi:oligopeptide transport system ATP-binding protein
MAGDRLLELRDVVKTFGSGGLVSRRDPIKAVRGVTLDVMAGEILAVVGESGCGKTTLGRMAVGLDAATDGEIRYAGKSLSAMDAGAARDFRCGVQMIFQDTYGSLNPFHTVTRLVSEPWRAFPSLVPRSQRRQRVLELLEMVGLGPEHADRLPAQLSGGQRQRVGIARALALDPKIIVCDEPVSALDVSVQAQIINLLRRLRRELGVSYLFISHDLRLVSYLADRVAVMYLGKIVEIGSVEEVFSRPTHPYTQVLLSNAPEPFPWRQDAVRLSAAGEVPSPANPPSGCGFRTRCWKAEQRCSDVEPELIDRLGAGHPAACHFPAFRPELTGAES